MGKYPNSEIHNLYSDFHWNLINRNDKYKRLYTADIDRLWIEYDFNHSEIVGVLDIKWLNSTDTLTPTEEGIYKWFKKHGVRTFTVFIDRKFKKFKVLNEKNDEKLFNEIQYADFLLALRNNERLKDFINNYTGYIDLDKDQLKLFRNI